MAQEPRPALDLEQRHAPRAQHPQRVRPGPHRQVAFEDDRHTDDDNEEGGGGGGSSCDEESAEFSLSFYALRADERFCSGSRFLIRFVPSASYRRSSAAFVTLYYYDALGGARASFF